MNTQDLQKLKAAALAATPGPWKAHASTETLHPVRTENGRIVADVGYSGSLDRDAENAAFIAAANPAAILELIALAERHYEAPICTACGDGIVGHDPGICGNCLTAERMGDTSSAGSAVVMSDNEILKIGAPFLSDGQGFARKPELFEIVAFARAVLSAAAAQPAPTTAQQPVATVASRAGNDFRVGWLRPELCGVGTMLYAAAQAPQDTLLTVANDVRFACMKLYSPDDTATDWADKMAALDIRAIVASAAMSQSSPNAAEAGKEAL